MNFGNAPFYMHLEDGAFSRYFSQYNDSIGAKPDWAVLGHVTFQVDSQAPQTTRLYGRKETDKPVKQAYSNSPGEFQRSNWKLLGYASFQVEDQPPKPAKVHESLSESGRYLI